ncbi:short-chain dehydrogenase [Bacillus solimangrovi]|uniref:Short-chain dehydrogenase n=1 Tax=Bacillus solimangrovi TaxID=1305675 RepID=A0A1E5LEB9_9BACI|nr:short-chain dehydrogenase [Bacillus solimangrovi]OEH92438.1 short-chain dehydrogenase [Bacillus solimangrovi]
MPCVHEFGIIDDFDIGKDYGDYAPKKYNCITVEDDLIQELSKDLKLLKSYFHSYDRPEFGLAYYGITIIPPPSLSFFYNVVVSSSKFKSSEELIDLAAIIVQASEEQKYMIHFGV